MGPPPLATASINNKQFIPFIAESHLSKQLLLGEDIDCGGMSSMASPLSVYGIEGRISLNDSIVGQQAHLATTEAGIKIDKEDDATITTSKRPGEFA